MKRWDFHIVFFSVLILMSAGTIQAQDAGMSDVEIVDEHSPLDAEKTTYIPGEDVPYIPNAPAAAAEKDSVMLQIQDFPMQQATMKKPEKSSEKQSAKAKDESILTFNFLYYIIQKYKLQDIID